MILMILALIGQTPGADDAVECRARPAEALVGERYRRHVPTRAKKLSGARTIRVQWPGEMATADYRTDRLSIRVDHRRLITSVRCG